MNSEGRKEQKIQNSLKELFIKLDKHEKFNFNKIIIIIFIIIDVIQKIYIILLDILLMKLIFKKT
jgi:hypothetical protein